MAEDAKDVHLCPGDYFQDHTDASHRFEIGGGAVATDDGGIRCILTLNSPAATAPRYGSRQTPGCRTRPFALAKKPRAFASAAGRMSRRSSFSMTCAERWSMTRRRRDRLHCNWRCFFRLRHRLAPRSFVAAWRHGNYARSIDI